MTAKLPTEKGAEQSAPSSPLTVNLSSQLPRLLKRLAVLPASPSRDELVDAVRGTLEHFDQFPILILRSQIFGWTMMVSALESEIDADASIARDTALQASKRKPRNPEVDAWIDRQLLADPFAKAPDLWGRAPSRVTDVLAFDRFSKRVTLARKRRM